ncbi:GNAT family N-acetyltransferase [Cytobacillus oceanisediminis]|uniref:GNAT family N-acetyltransferase n=1 Tax=Cytobacillus oceanisediminis TaxID=665099 RepID=UPI003736DA8D
MEVIELQKMEIRNALDIVWKVFLEFEAPDYSEQGIEEFSKFISYDSIITKLGEGELHFWGCKVNDKLVGVIATRSINHICLLFVKKEYQRRGIARALFELVKEICRKHKHIGCITVNSSPYGVEVYHRLGFEDTDQEQTVNGIRFTPMSYLLK